VCVWSTAVCGVCVCVCVCVCVISHHDDLNIVMNQCSFHGFSLIGFGVGFRTFLFFVFGLFNHVGYFLGESA
jgi:hypothetical protein